MAVTSLARDTFYQEVHLPLDQLQDEVMYHMHNVLSHAHLPVIDPNHVWAYFHILPKVYIP